MVQATGNIATFYTTLTKKIVPALLGPSWTSTTPNGVEITGPTTRSQEGINSKGNIIDPSQYPFSDKNMFFGSLPIFIRSVFSGCIRSGDATKNTFFKNWFRRFVYFSTFLQNGVRGACIKCVFLH